MSRTRIVLVAVLLVAAGWLAFQQFQRMAEERAAKAVQETSAAMVRAFRESRRLEAQQTAKPQVFSPTLSAWQSGEKIYYERLLSKGRFDLLVVPFQVQDYALDRTTRSLMTAELALAVGAAQKKVPDPYLVARVLGDGERSLNAGQINRLADKLKVTRIVSGHVGHLRDNTMRITIQYQDRSEDPAKPWGSLGTRHFEKVPFSEEDPPAEVFQRMLPEVLRTIGLDPAPSTGLQAESRFEGAELPPGPLQMVSDRAEPARDAYYL